MSEERVSKKTVKHNRRNLSKNGKLFITAVISIVLGIIIELILTKGTKTFIQFSFTRMLKIAGITFFVLLHFILGFKKLYEYIINHRYKLAIVMIILSSLIEIPNENIFRMDIEFGLYWNIRFYVLLLTTYDFFRVITGGKIRLSIAGTILVAFSGHVQYFFYYVNTFILGELAIIILNRYLTDKSGMGKFYLSAFFIVGILYSFMLKSFLVTYGYIFLAIAIWQIWENSDPLDKKKTLYLFLAIAIIIIETIIVRNFVPYFKEQNSWLFPAEGTFFDLSEYLLAPFIPFYREEIPNADFVSTFISLCPIPVFFGLYCVYRYERHYKFLFPVCVITMIEMILYFGSTVESLDIVRKITMISLEDNYILLNAINYGNLLILMYFVSRYVERTIKPRTTILLTIVSALITLIIFNRPEILNNKGKLTLFAIEYFVLVFTFFNYEDSKYVKILISTMIILTFISGLPVHPIIYENYYTDIDGENVEEIDNIDGEIMNDEIQEIDPELIY